LKCIAVGLWQLDERCSAFACSQGYGAVQAGWRHDESARARCRVHMRKDVEI
jgi:hypothetical protein